MPAVWLRRCAQREPNTKQQQLNTAAPPLQVTVPDHGHDHGHDHGLRRASEAAATASTSPMTTPGTTTVPAPPPPPTTVDPHAPYVDRAHSKNVTALLGKTAYLNCRVKNLGNKTVSWVRHRDIHLLTVARYTYTNDQRFRATHNAMSDDWMLQLKYPQHRDAGVYECQVSTTPHLSHFIHLSVVEPKTEIIGAPELFIDRGSTINLTCIILYSPEPPAYVFWNHNDSIISYESPRGGVEVQTARGDTTTSVLLIRKAKPSDSGQYKCNPSNAQSQQVHVNVLNGELPAAMQHGGQGHHQTSHLAPLLVTALTALLWHSRSTVQVS
ncbi:zwei Ig domain protein zig-8-like [Thrips palmi]|uniref:Zwei Ig domain protein zig-8-like n=1 Tax=Thrips palmi TaxID=161013 RepID=A0A6P8YSY6_THRPL|nr:zwei Ig domain protein zig-8-like [Thrips palmi]